MLSHPPTWESYCKIFDMVPGVTMNKGEDKIEKKNKKIANLNCWISESELLMLVEIVQPNSYRELDWVDSADISGVLWLRC